MVRFRILKHLWAGWGTITEQEKDIIKVSLDLAGCVTVERKIVENNRLPWLGRYISSSDQLQTLPAVQKQTILS
jgi:hypothetical protein